jgi:hypothetical protein
LVQATLDLLILKIILRELRHGWAIAKRIQQVSQEALQVQRITRSRAGVSVGLLAPSVTQMTGRMGKAEDSNV